MIKDFLAAIGAATLLLLAMSFAPTPPQEKRLVPTQEFAIARGTLVDIRIRRADTTETIRATIVSSLGDWVVFETDGARTAMNREQLESISTVGR